MKKVHRNRTSRIAANVTPARADLTVFATNARAIGTSDDGWEQITPWGNFPNPAGVQRLTIQQGQAMVAAFNALLAKLKDDFRGVPIYAGHPDVDPRRWPDDRRIGKVVKLEARADGFYCKPAWNDLGEQNNNEGYWIYPSGVWKFKKCPGGVIEPFELVSVGLTNNPNIPGVQPWARNDGDTRSGGPLADYAKRRAAGCAGDNNPLAMRARAAMRAKKQPLPLPSTQSISSGSGHQVHIHIQAPGNVAKVRTRPRSRLAKNDGTTIAQQISEQKKIEAGHAAGMALLQKAAEFEKQGYSTQMSLLRARQALPESAKVAEHHNANMSALREEKQKRQDQEAFVQKVRALMAEKKITYTAAWLILKKQQEQQQGTPAK